MEQTKIFDARTYLRTVYKKAILEGELRTFSTTKLEDFGKLLRLIKREYDIVHRENIDKRVSELKEEMERLKKEKESFDNEKEEE